MDFSVKENKAVGEKYYYKKHKSGLDIYVYPKEFGTSYAAFATKFGSCESEFVTDGKKVTLPDGVAHFLEHKMFENPDGRDTFELYAKTGASANAYTSNNRTVYLFSAADNVYESLEILLGFVTEPYFTDKTVAKEQGIIGQEIKMYDDNGPWRVFFNLLGALYHNHPVRKDIAGTVESISHITDELLYKCYNTFYNLSNMMIFVTGDFDVTEIEKCIDDGIKTNEPFEEEIKRIYPNEPETVCKSVVEQSLSVAMPLFMIGFKDTDNGYSGDELLRKYIEVSIINKILFSKGGELFETLFAEGLINDSFSSDYTAQPDYAHVMVEGESADPKAVYDRIMEHIGKLMKDGLPRDEVERTKKVIWGDYIKSYNDVEEFSHAFLNLYMADAMYTNYEKVYGDVTYEDVCRRFEMLYSKDKTAISIINPL